MSKRLERLSRCIEPRTSRPIPPPALPRTKAWCRRRAHAEERSLQAQRSGECRKRRKSLRPCATREAHEPRLTDARDWLIRDALIQRSMKAGATQTPRPDPAQVGALDADGNAERSTLPMRQAANDPPS